MQLRLPLWYVFLLLCAPTLQGRAAPICTNKKQARDDDDSDDDSDDDDDDSSHHRTSCSTGTSQHGVSKGAVAGIIIGILILLLLLILLAWWCARRRKRSRQPISLGPVGTLTTTPMRERTPPQTLRNHPPGLRPSSMVAESPANAHPVGAAMAFSDSTGRRETREFANVPPARVAESHESHESLPLPNPYEQDTPPTPPPHDDVVLSPTSPISPAPTSREASLYASTSLTSNSHSHARSYSAAPSAWTHDDSTAPLLSRGTTQASRASASSSLHEEIAGYQKALEAHHHKEEEAAGQRERRIGEGSAVPEDPPPVYRDREEQ
ncbi:hypothetical protein C8Q78DRAFT_1075331 [Trametes maxima]|nr:hypothetical protein C8Q78DRAFT_1075331 [Trametes maxima]